MAGVPSLSAVVRVHTSRYSRIAHLAAAHGLGTLHGLAEGKAVFYGKPPVSADVGQAAPSAQTSGASRGGCKPSRAIRPGRSFS